MKNCLVKVLDMTIDAELPYFNKVVIKKSNLSEGVLSATIQNVISVDRGFRTSACYYTKLISVSPGDVLSFSNYKDSFGVKDSTKLRVLYVDSTSDIYVNNELLIDRTHYDWRQDLSIVVPDNENTQGANNLKAMLSFYTPGMTSEDNVQNHLVGDIEVAL